MQKIQIKLSLRHYTIGLVICLGMLMTQVTIAQNTLQKGNNSTPSPTADQAFDQPIDDLVIDADLNTLKSYVQSKLYEIEQGNTSFDETEEAVRTYFYKTVLENFGKNFSAEKNVKLSLSQSAQYNKQSFKNSMDMTPFYAEVDSDL